MILITARHPGSAWSAINRAHVASARTIGAMTPAGTAKNAAASANGPWYFLTDVDALTLPPDLTTALHSTGTATFCVARSFNIRRAALD